MLWHTIINDYEALDLGTGIFGRLCGASEKWLLINRTPSNSIDRSIDYLYFEISFNSKVNTFFSFQFIQSTLQLILRFNCERWVGCLFQSPFHRSFSGLTTFESYSIPYQPVLRKESISQIPIFLFPEKYNIHFFKHTALRPCKEINILNDFSITR